MAETWCITVPKYAETCLKDYEFTIIPATKDRIKGRWKGGLVLATKLKITIKKTTDKSIYFYLETTVGKTLIIMQYAPPDISGDDEMLQALTEMEEEESGHAILIGDLNARISKMNPTNNKKFIGRHRQSRDVYNNPRGNNLIKIINRNGWLIMNGSTTSDKEGHITFRNKNGCSCIDLCMSTSTTASCVEDFEVLTSHLSHHNPILLKLAPRSKPTHNKTMTTPTSFLPRIYWNPEKLEEFLNTFTQLQPQSDSEIVWDWEWFKNTVYQAAETVGILKNVSTTSNKNTQLAKWFDTECRDTRAKLRRMSKILRRQHNPLAKLDLEQHYHSLKCEYSFMKKSKKRDEMEKNLQQILNAARPKEFWEAIGKHRGKFAQNNNTISKDEWHKYFSNLFCGKEIADPEVENNLTPPLIATNEEISQDELHIAIKKLSNRKAPGIDGIPNEIFKAISIKYKAKLLGMINEIFNYCKVPEEWCKIIVNPIYKKGDKNDPGNYRPISLVPTGLKLVTSILSSRLQQWSENEDKISEFQVGFKKGIGTQEQIFTLTTVIQSKLKERSGKLFVAYLDLKAAFDSPDHDLLWKRLKNLGMNQKILDFLMKIYSIANGTVKTTEGLTNSFKIGQGVLQGESASSTLFNLYINAIVDVLHESDIPGIALGSYLIHILLFADDQAVLASTAYQLQQKLDLISELFDLLGLTLNASKTKIMIFEKRKSKSQHTFTWKYETLQIVNEFTYLGVTFHRNGHFREAAKDFISKAVAAATNVLDICWKARIPPIEVHRNLFSTLSKSVLLYCGPVWGLNYTDEIEAVQCKFWKKLLRLPQSTPGYVVRLETKSTHLSYDTLKVTLKFFIRLMNRKEDSLVGQCLKWQFRWASRINSEKRCWGSALRTLVRELTGDESIFDQPLTTIRQLLPLNLHEILGKVKCNLINKDVSRMVESKWTPEYGKIKTNINLEPYFQMNLPLSTVQIIAQMRVNLLSLKWKDCKIPLQGVGPCPWCQEERASLNHYLMSCMQLECPRKLYLRQFLKHQSLIETFANNTSDPHFYKNLFLFWIHCFKIILPLNSTL